MPTDSNGMQLHGNSEIICLICQSPIEHDESNSICPSCNKPYHTECWSLNKGCAVYGCPQVPPTEGLKELEIPVSYWGKEKKMCPSCGKEILAAALRCSLCGAIFSSARPITLAQFKGEKALKEKKSTLQWYVIIIFVLNIFTFTAPLGLLTGLIWYRLKNKELTSLPHMYRTLCKIGIGIGMLQTVLMIILSVFYAIFHK